MYGYGYTYPKLVTTAGVLGPKPPAGYLAWLFGGTTDGLTIPERVGTIDDVTIVDRPCLTFDGTGDCIIYGDILDLMNSSSDFSIEFDADLTSVLQFEVIMGKLTSGLVGWRIDIPTATTLSFFAYNGTTSKGIYISFTGGLKKYKIERVSDQYTWYVDGVAQTPGSDTLSGQAVTASAAGNNFEVGRRKTNLYPIMTFLNFRATQGGVDVVHCPCEEASGSIVYDVSGNGNHGAITSSSTPAVMWGSTCDEASHVAQYGFGLVASDVTTGANGTTYGVDSFTNHGDGTYTMVETGDGGGGMAIPNVFHPTDDGTYLVRYKLTGTSTANIRIRSVNDLNGNSSVGDLNLLVATVDGAWHEIEFTQTIDAYPHLQIGASIAGNMNLLVEVEVLRLDVQVPALPDGSADAAGGTLTNPGGYVHNGGSYSLLWPASVGNLSGLTKTYAEILAIAQTPVDTDNWQFSYDSNNNIVDGIYYNPALTGADLTALYTFLNKRHA